MRSLPSVARCSETDVHTLGTPLIPLPFYLFPNPSSLLSSISREARLA